MRYVTGFSLTNNEKNPNGINPNIFIRVLNKMLAAFKDGGFKEDIDDDAYLLLKPVKLEDEIGGIQFSATANNAHLTLNSDASISEETARFLILTISSMFCKGNYTIDLELDEVQKEDVLDMCRRLIEPYSVFLEGLYDKSQLVKFEEQEQYSDSEEMEFRPSSLLLNKGARDRIGYNYDDRDR